MVQIRCGRMGLEVRCASSVCVLLREPRCKTGHLHENRNLTEFCVQTEITQFNECKERPKLPSQQIPEQNYEYHLHKLRQRTLKTSM